MPSSAAGVASEAMPRLGSENVSVATTAPPTM